MVLFDDAADLAEDPVESVEVVVSGGHSAEVEPVPP
jgi:hypothetical protein